MGIIYFNKVGHGMEKDGEILGRKCSKKLHLFYRNMGLRWRLSKTHLHYVSHVALYDETIK